MAFFDELKQKVMTGSKQVADKAKEVADTTKLKGQIASEKSKMKEAYGKLGELYYEAHKEDPENEAFAAQMAVISASLQAIETFENEIERIKSAAADQAEAKSELDETAVEDQAEAPSEEEPQETADQPEKICEHCGEKLSADASFCSNCGNPVL